VQVGQGGGAAPAQQHEAQAAELAAEHHLGTGGHGGQRRDVEGGRPTTLPRRVHRPQHVTELLELGEQRHPARAEAVELGVELLERVEGVVALHVQAHPLSAVEG
jgi:hypothetical protein